MVLVKKCGFVGVFQFLTSEWTRVQGWLFCPAMLSVQHLDRWSKSYIRPLIDKSNLPFPRLRADFPVNFLLGERRSALDGRQRQALELLKIRAAHHGGV